MLEASPAVYSILELIYVSQIMCPLVLGTIQFTITEVEILADSEISGK